MFSTHISTLKEQVVHAMQRQTQRKQEKAHCIGGGERAAAASGSGQCSKHARHRENTSAHMNGQMHVFFCVHPIAATDQDNKHRWCRNICCWYGSMRALMSSVQARQQDVDWTITTQAGNKQTCLGQFWSSYSSSSWAMDAFAHCSGARLIFEAILKELSCPSQPTDAHSVGLQLDILLKSHS